MKDVIPAIEALKTASTDRINALETRNREQAERLQALEQAPRSGGPNFAEPARAEGPADLLLKSSQLAALRAGETKSLRIPVKSFHMETKATLISTAAGGAPYRAPVVTTDLPLRVSVRSLIPSRPTTAGSIEYVRTTRVGLAGAQVGEGTLKPEIDLSAALIHQPVITVAGWTNVSKQMLDDDVSLRETAGATLLEALTYGEDLELLKGDGTLGHVPGFMTLATAYSRTTAGDTAIDQLRRAVTQLQLAHGIPDGIVISPAGLEALELRKDSLGDYVLSLEVDVLSRTNLWRVPVVVSTALAATEFLVGCFAAGSILYDRQIGTLEISAENNDNFTRNILTIRAEERFALCVTRPALFVTGTLVP